VQYHPVGAKLTMRNASGTWAHDFGLFIEYFNSPIYDITPAYITTWKPNQAFTLGGGIALHRFISPTPGTKKELTKSFEYYKNLYLPETQSTRRFNLVLDGYSGTKSFEVAYSTGAQPNIDSVKNAIYAAEGGVLAIYGVNSAAELNMVMDTDASSMKDGEAAQYVTRLKADVDAQLGEDTTAVFANPLNAGRKVESVSFDLSAAYLMAFFNLDINALLGRDPAGMGQFKLYGEVAQLGLKNYPIFYTQYAQRMPVMLGASIPTFILDDFSIEIEYLNNPIIESIASTYDKLNLAPDENFRYKVYNQDNMKWSVHATKSLSKFLTVYAQVANDHMRLKNGFAQPQFVPITNQKKDWYWLMRIQWMI
jgi:hypothetical protein